MSIVPQAEIPPKLHEGQTPGRLGRQSGVGKNDENNPAWKGKSVNSVWDSSLEKNIVAKLLPERRRGIEFLNFYVL